MKPTLLFRAFWLCAWPVLAFGQTSTAPPTAYLTPKDSLFLTVDDDGRKIVQHPVKAKQTLFSLAKFYGLSLQELYEHNPEFQTNPTLKAGSRVKIPVPNLAIKRYKGKSFVAAKHTPIFYVVQDGETLYQICKRNFDMPVDSVLKRNKLKTSNISPGQLLLIGWMGTEGIPAEWRQSREPATTNDLKTTFEKEKTGRKEISASGVCFWQRDSNEKGDLYALHREAAIGTSVSVYNPMTKKTVFAKVIGRIPDGYEKNVEVILSPAAARVLGARDPRFFVKVRYLK